MGQRRGPPRIATRSVSARLAYGRTGRSAGATRWSVTDRVARAVAGTVGLVDATYHPSRVGARFGRSASGVKRLEAPRLVRAKREAAAGLSVPALSGVRRDVLGGVDRASVSAGDRAADVRVEAVAGEEGVGPLAPHPRIVMRPSCEARRSRSRMAAASSAEATVGSSASGPSAVAAAAQRHDARPARDRPSPGRCPGLELGAERRSPRGRARSRDSTQARRRPRRRARRARGRRSIARVDELRAVAGLGQAPADLGRPSASVPRGSAPAASRTTCGSSTAARSRHVARS